MTPVIDVHTHMLSDEWLRLILAHGEGYSLTEFHGQRVFQFNGSPFMTLMDPMFDYAQRIEDMDKAGVDIAVVSLTCPSVYWGGEEISHHTARIMNDDMAQQQKNYPDRIRWFATLPWQYPQKAVEELERAAGIGTSGVFVSANVGGMSLTDPSFIPVWQAIDEKALPVLVHPTVPQGASQMDLKQYNLVPSIGFTFDTTLAVSRMIYDGFFDRYQKLKIIAAHAGGALPYLLGRLDRCYETMPACRETITELPSSYIDRIYFDAVTYRQDSLELCINVAGAANVMYGSDYPHNLGDMKGCLSRVDALPPEQRDAVRGKNAMRIFGF